MASLSPSDCSDPIGTEALCTVSGLRHAYGRHTVLQNCGFVIRRGEVVGLTGENGSGKTTLVHCLLRFVRPDAGRIECTPSVGYCPQESYLHRSLTVREHLALVAALRPCAAPDPADYLSRCIEALRLVRHLDHPIRKLSGGTYQKLKFLTAIAHRPQLLVLDEPTDGFDWSMYQVFWQVVGSLVERGAGVLMISHLLIDRQRFDRILELREGALHDA